MRSSLVGLGAVALAVPLLYTLSWNSFAREQRLYSFAVESVRVIGLERWANSRVVELKGFGGAASRELRRLRESLQAQGFQVCVAAEVPESEICRGLPDDAITIEARVDALKPFKSIVALRWMQGGKGEEYRYGFWWNGVSWSRDTDNDERGTIVTLVQSSYWLKLTVRPVTGLVCARPAPARPAA